MSWCNVTEFKLKTGIVFNSDETISDVLIQEALDAAVTDIREKVFIQEMYQSRDPKTTHYISGITKGSGVPLASSSNIMMLADWNADKQITIADLNIFTLDDNFNEVDVSSDVVDFKPKYGVITFGSNQPTSGTTQTLIIEFATAKHENSVIQSSLEELNRLAAVNWLLVNVPFKKLQRGISSWTINGVNVNFDANAMKTMIEDNSKRINDLIKQTAPVYMRRSTLRRRDYNGYYLGGNNNTTLFRQRYGINFR